MKYLIWLALIIIVLMWLSRGKKSVSQSTGRTGQAAGAGNAQAGAAEAMLKCAHCGMHIPASEAIIVRPDAVFCCEEHRVRHAPR